MNSKKLIEGINPTTEEKLYEYTPMSSDEINQHIEKMNQVRKEWASNRLEKRLLLIKKIAKLLDIRKKEYSILITKSVGKPIQEAEKEIEKCVSLCNYYIEHAPDILKSKRIALPTKNKIAYKYYQPMGIILAIMPWNFPFWQVFRFAIPNLIGGNSVLLKHASNVMNIAKTIENIFIDAEHPKGLFKSLIITSKQVSEIIKNPLVHGVTITGSEQTGALVASQAGKLIKPTVLELGGSDPYIICSNADLDLAVKSCIISRLTNSGQVCISAKRIILEKSIKNSFIDKLINYVKLHYRVGDPMHSTTKIGPMVRKKDQEKVHQQVLETIEAGAKCLLGGELINEKGFFYPPTILINIPKGSPPHSKEIFGPIIALFIAQTDEEAISIANDTPYGLGAAIFSQNIEKAVKMAEKIEAGSCYINDFVASNPYLPFGGWKKSGYGLELGEEGLKSFMNTKVIVQNLSPGEKFS